MNVTNHQTSANIFTLKRHVNSIVSMVLVLLRVNVSIGILKKYVVIGYQLGNAEKEIVVDIDTLRTCTSEVMQHREDMRDKEEEV